MVKNDSWILRYLKKNVMPWWENHVNPTSYDLTWSGRYREMRKPQSFENPRINSWDRGSVQRMWSEVYSADELTLSPNKLYLLDTEEHLIIPDNIMGLIFLKSSIGRAGIEHLHAGLFDPGFNGTGTLEVVNITPWHIAIQKGQRIVQMTFLSAQKPLKSYREIGRYNNYREPIA